MQFLDAHINHGLYAGVKEMGLEDAYQYFKERLSIIISNVRKLQEAYRAKREMIIHTKMESLLEDGRDRSLQHKQLGVHAAPGSFEGRFLPELEPKKGEIVFSKTASSPFNSTNIDYVLRNLGIEQLIIVGVVTNGCISTTVRDASDLSYEVVLIEDACAAVTEKLHTSTIEAIRDDYAKIRSTENIISEIMSL